MEEVQKSTGRHWGIGVVVVILAVIAFVYVRILGMDPEEQEELLYLLQDFLPKKLMVLSFQWKSTLDKKIFQYDNANKNHLCLKMILTLIFEQLSS